MIKVGVTGGIGSGKTTFCRVWEKLGASVYYADKAAKKLMISDPELILKLKLAFGETTYHSDGSLNKEHLIKEAFQKGEVHTLNRIVHPAVAEDFSEFVKRAEYEKKEIVVKEAALLLMGGRPEDLDLIVLVLSEKENRVARVVQRDGVSESDVKHRDSKQPAFDQLVHLADHIVKNNGTINELEAEAEKLYKMILD